MNELRKLPPVNSGERGGQGVQSSLPVFLTCRSRSILEPGGLCRLRETNQRENSRFGGCRVFFVSSSLIKSLSQILQQPNERGPIMPSFFFFFFFDCLLPTIISAKSWTEPQPHLPPPTTTTPIYFYRPDQTVSVVMVTQCRTGATWSLI